MQLNKGRIEGLDLVRSMAILLVLALHQAESISATPDWLKLPFSYGWSGVNIFFVLSGYLIGSQVFKEDQNSSLFQSLKEFWIKRWFRTLPLYFFVLTFYLFVKPFVLKLPFQGNVFDYVFFLQNYTEIRDFPQSWSLCVEEHFYLLFPLFAFGFKSFRSRPWLLLIPVFLSPILRWMIIKGNPALIEPHISYLIRFPTHTNLDSLCFGVFLSFTPHNWRGLASKFSTSLFIGGSALFALTLMLNGPIPLGHAAVWSPTFLAISSCLMVMGAINLKVPSKISPMIYWISTCSYGIYLWNNAFMRFVEKYLHYWPWYLAAIFFYGLTFLLSYTTYKLVEVPFLRLRERFLSTTKTELAILGKRPL